MAFHLAIDKPSVQQLERRGKRLVAEVFRVFKEDPKHLIPSWIDGEPSTSTCRRVCDYIAGMTDHYAEKVYSRLFVPGVGSSADEL
jgi:dGTPase